VQTLRPVPTLQLKQMEAKMFDVQRELQNQTYVFTPILLGTHLSKGKRLLVLSGINQGCIGYFQEWVSENEMKVTIPSSEGGSTEYFDRRNGDVKLAITSNF
jgi:hypothetical protein